MPFQTITLPRHGDVTFTHPPPPASVPGYAVPSQHVGNGTDTHGSTVPIIKTANLNKTGNWYVYVRNKHKHQGKHQEAELFGIKQYVFDIWSLWNYISYAQRAMCSICRWQLHRNILEIFFLKMVITFDGFKAQCCFWLFQKWRWKNYIILLCASAFTWGPLTSSCHYLHGFIQFPSIPVIVLENAFMNS